MTTMKLKVPLSPLLYQQACIDLGFVKPDVGAAKPLAQRANVADFFKALGCTSFSGFKQRFYGEQLPEPFVGQEPLVAEKVRRAEERATPKQTFSSRIRRSTPLSLSCLPSPLFWFWFSCLPSFQPLSPDMMPLTHP
jgi:hypothetical protein